MNAIKIYYYTAWNGYSWQGCDDATAAGLQQYMEAAGVLPGDAGREPPFGGAIACQVGGCMGVAVYRCGIRSKGDAFGRDSLFISLAFVPLEYGPADFSAIMSLSQMSPSVKGELLPISVSMSDIASSSVARRDVAWRDESFTMHFNGISGLRDASSFFFLKSCQLGLLQATFESSTGSVAGVSVSLSYHVFPEIAALAEASRAYADARKLSRGSISDEHPVSMKLWDAVIQLQTRRIDKMPGYTGLAEYLSERDAELGGVIARAPKYVRRTPERQTSVNVAATTSPCGAPNPKRNARTSKGLRSWLPYLLVAIGIMLVVGFAALVISSRFSALKVKRDGDVRRLEEKIKELEDERDRAKKRGERDLDNARDQWKEEIRERDDTISRLEKSCNSTANSNRVLQAELGKAKDKLAEDGKKYRELQSAATNIIYSIRTKRIEDARKMLRDLSMAARVLANEEIADARKQEERIDEEYNKGCDKIIINEKHLDGYIDKCKRIEKGYIAAFEKAHRIALGRVEELNRNIKELGDKNNSLKNKTEDASPKLAQHGGVVVTPRKYKYDILEDKDSEPHKPDNLFCCQCWRCKDADKLEKVLADLKKAREVAKKERAFDYAKAAYDAAMSEYENAHADKLDDYKTLLMSAKSAFENAARIAKDNTKDGSDPKSNRPVSGAGVAPTDQSLDNNPNNNTSNKDVRSESNDKKPQK